MSLLAISHKPRRRGRSRALSNALALTTWGAPGSSVVDGIANVSDNRVAPFGYPMSMQKPRSSLYRIKRGQKMEETVGTVEHFNLGIYKEIAS